jgi:hypothetical protein
MKPHECPKGPLKQGINEHRPGKLLPKNLEKGTKKEAKRRPKKRPQKKYQKRGQTKNDLPPLKNGKRVISFFSSLRSPGSYAEAA